MSKETIKMSIPAQATYARSVRMMAASLGVVCGLNVSEVEDIRMACEEGFIYVCHADDEFCEIEFSICDNKIEIDLVSQGKVDIEEDVTLQYSNLLIEAMCDDYSIDTKENTTCVHLVKCSDGDYGN